MPDLAAAAHRLRQVRQARQMFLTLWAIEYLDRRPAAVDRILSDVLSASAAVLHPDARPRPATASWPRRFGR